MEKLNSLLCLGAIALPIALIGVHNIVTKRARTSYVRKLVEGKEAVTLGWLRIIFAIVWFDRAKIAGFIDRIEQLEKKLGDVIRYLTGSAKKK